MKFAPKILISFCIFMASPLSYAQLSVDGHSLVHWIKEGYQKSNAVDGLFLGFVMGVVETSYERWAKYNLVCLPQKSSPGQLQAVTAKYVQDNPQDWNLPGFILVTAAMQQSFPCRK